MESSSLPAAIEAEKSILGAVLLDNTIYDQTLGLRPEDFYLDGHRRIFSAMVTLRERSHPVDLITLTNHLTAVKDLEGCGGVAYVASLPDGVPRRPSIAQYVRIVRDKAAARGMIHACNNAMARAFDQADPIQQVISETEAQLFDIVGARIERDFATPGEIIQQSYGGLEGFYNRRKDARGLDPGFYGLRDFGVFWRKKELIVVAGRPSMGKTALLKQEADRIACDLDEPVCVYSLEMSRESFLDSMACAKAGVSYDDLVGGFLGREGREKMQHALDRLINAPLYIDDTPDITIGQMRAKARKLARVKGHIALIGVDYLQLMNGQTGKKNAENRNQEVSAISRGLKIMAGEQKCPVMALSQLSRAPEQRSGNDQRPRLSDLRESGSIEQDADVVIFPFRPEYYDRDNEELKGKAELIVGKHRMGATGTAHLGWQREYARFVNLTHGGQ